MIAKINKKERKLITKVINGNAYGESKLFIKVPSGWARVSDYMLAFGDYISVKFTFKKDDKTLMK